MCARAIQAGAAPYEASWPRIGDAVVRWAGLRSVPVPADLAAWAADLRDDHGVVPLLGTAGSADPYPALLWNGARSARAGLGSDERLLLVALVAGGAQLRAGQLSRAVAAGATVAEVLSGSTPDAVAATGVGTAVPPGRVTGEVIAAAVCAALAGEAAPERLTEILDLAATLMLARPPATDGVVERGLWAGHAAAAGWLAPILLDSGIRSVEDAVGHVLDTVGPPARDESFLHLPDTGTAGTGTAGDAGTPSTGISGGAQPALGRPDRLIAGEMWAMLR